MNAPQKYPGFWQAALLCVLFVAFQSLLVMPVMAAQFFLKVRLVDHPATIGVANCLAFGLTLTVAFLLGRQPLRQTLALRRVPLALLGGVAVTMTGAVILLSEADNLFRMVLPMPEWILTIFQNAFASERSPLGSLVVLVLVAPLTEEPLCRGLMLQGFLGRYRPFKAVLLSALLFAGLHMNPWQFISAFALGGLLGWWFWRTGSLIPCLAGHAVYNGCVFAGPYLPFEIPGFNQGEMLASAGFQPWWLDLIGVALTVAGLALFCRAASAMRPFQPEMLLRVPPTLPPTLMVPPPIPVGDQAALPTAEGVPPVIGSL